MSDEGVTMRTIDVQTWQRRCHFRLFQQMDYPHFNVCAPVNIAATLKVVKAKGGSVNLAVVYALARAANDLAPFRFRIRGEDVVEHDAVHPSITVLGEDDLFSYCTIPWSDEFVPFRTKAEALITLRKQERMLEDEPGQDDLLFMSGLPWIAFTSITHPIHMHPADSIPRISWGQFQVRGEEVPLPVSVQVHHALMDGLHVSRYFQRVQDLFDHIQDWWRPSVLA